MNVLNVVLILGKRLVDDQLTAEGVSRVNALIKLLENVDRGQMALVFCGGVTSGQTRSEAQALWQYFEQIKPTSLELPVNVLLEDQSLNTIENIRNAADKLIESGFCHSGQEIKVTFVSNDYHLQRIFEIQTLMDEQGLLRVLKQKCAQTGLSLSISTNLHDHCAAPYPHDCIRGKAFLLSDELTTYRVYLEGVKANAFSKKPCEVRDKPYQIAKRALNELKAMNFEGEVNQAILEIERAVAETTPNADEKQISDQLTVLHHRLTWLNRQFDPERYSVELQS